MSKRTEISTLGEFGLIRHLTDDIKPQQPSTAKGVGDDCAVIELGEQSKEKGGRCMLLTTDLLLEGIHFDLTYVPLKHLGYKAAMVKTFFSIKKAKSICVITSPLCSFHSFNSSLKGKA